MALAAADTDLLVLLPFLLSTWPPGDTLVLTTDSLSGGPLQAQGAGRSHGRSGWQSARVVSTPAGCLLLAQVWQ